MPTLDGYLPEKLAGIYERDVKFREIIQAAFDFEVPIEAALVNVILAWDEERQSRE